MKEFKYSVGQLVMQRYGNEVLEAEVLKRSVINGHNAYVTSLNSKWVSETYLSE